MSTDASEESGLEELLRLSREIGEMEKSLVHDLAQAGEKIHLSEKKLAMWDLVKDIKESLILEKLSQVSSDDEYSEFISLKKARNNRGLRDMVLRISRELEDKVTTTDYSKPDLERRVKMLAILLEFLFYAE
jgi:hypothetical protein